MLPPQAKRQHKAQEASEVAAQHPEGSIAAKLSLLSIAGGALKLFRRSTLCPLPCQETGQEWGSCISPQTDLKWPPQLSPLVQGAKEPHRLQMGVRLQVPGAVKVKRGTVQKKNGERALLGIEPVKPDLFSPRG